MKPDPYPFPHIVIDDLFDLDLLRDVQTEILCTPAEGWQPFANDQEWKLAKTRRSQWGPRTRAFYDALASDMFCRGLTETFNMPRLVMDPIGGGYHATPPGGYLNVHADFNRNSLGLYRRLNLMTYLNDDWQDEGGLLELHANDRAAKYTYRPEFGKTVIFETSDTSWHGHPEPATRWRYSCAAYFFSEEQPDTYTHDHSTVWRDA